MCRGTVANRESMGPSSAPLRCDYQLWSIPINLLVFGPGVCTVIICGVGLAGTLEQPYFIQILNHD